VVSCIYWDLFIRIFFLCVFLSPFDLIFSFCCCRLTFSVCTILCLYVCLSVYAFNLVCVLLCLLRLIHSYFLSVFFLVSFRSDFLFLLSTHFLCCSVFGFVCLSVCLSMFFLCFLVSFSFWADEIQESIVFRETHFKMFTSTNFTIDYHLQWGCSTP
jgi:hypothetical protein